jgi:hypothetical protein
LTYRDVQVLSVFASRVPGGGRRGKPGICAPWVFKERKKTLIKGGSVPNMNNDKRCSECSKIFFYPQ